MLHPSFQKPRAEVAIEVRFNIESIQQRPGLLPMPTSMLPGFAATACGCTVGHEEGAKLRHGGPSGTAGHEKGTRPVQRARQSPAEHKHCTVKEDVALFLPWRVFPDWETTNARLGGHQGLSEGLWVAPVQISFIRLPWGPENVMVLPVHLLDFRYRAGGRGLLLLRLVHRGALGFPHVPDKLQPDHE